MARAVCCALLWLAVVRAEARYADYSVAKMPQYGAGSADYDGPRDVMAAAPSEDYVDHPAEASIAADYKYDDDTAKTEKLSNKEVEDSRERQIISKRHRLTQVEEENADQFDFGEDAETKLKTGRKFVKPRKLSRTRNSNIVESRRYAIRPKSNTFKENNIDEKDDIHVHHEEMPRQKRINLDDEDSNDNVHTNHDDVRKRIGDDTLDKNDDIQFKHDEPSRQKGLRMDDENIDKEILYKQDEPSRQKGLRIDDEDINKEIPYRTTTMRVARRKPRDRYVKKSTGSEEEDDDEWHKRLVSGNRRNFAPPEQRLALAKLPGRRRMENEQANEDMPSVPNPRRPFMSSDEDAIPIVVPKRRKESMAKSDDDYSYDMKRIEGIRERLPTLNRRPTQTTAPRLATTKTPDLREQLWANRRAMVPLPKMTSTSSTTTTPEIPRIISSQETTPPNGRTNADTFLMSSTDIDHVLSVAERSRLSILRKSLKKESVKGTTTKTPVVLMHVTRQMHTLVMVEPPTSIEPWMRAKVVSGDSPSRLKQVKRLMRAKLVQNAKNIHDLTENWDDMVCDYIDLDMVEDSSSNICFTSKKILIIVFLITYILLR